MTALLTSACYGHDAAPPSTSSVAPAETSTPEVTTTKPALRLWYPTPASAVAFIKYFFDVYNYSYATYDTTLLEAISKSSCTSCTGFINDIESYQKQGYVLAGSEARFEHAFFLESKPVLKNNHFFVLVQYSQRPGTETDRSGKVTKVDGEKDTKSGFGLDWDGGRWLVQGIAKNRAGTPWPA